MKLARRLTGSPTIPETDFYPIFLWVCLMAHLTQEPHRHGPQGRSRGGSHAVTLTEHGKANKRNREGSREVQEGEACGGSRAPPLQSPNTRYPPTRIGEAGR